MKSLTVWMTPFTSMRSIDQVVATVRALAAQAGRGWAPSFLLPTHFGKWPQAECRQSIPRDMLVSSPDDIASIRQAIEGAGIGFGCWGVPVDLDSPELASGFAAAGGYYCANFEPGEFWTVGDEPELVDAWWEGYWNSLPDQQLLSGNTSATVVPNRWGLAAFQRSLPNLAAGCGALLLEVYGGLQTAGQYGYPNLWPDDGFKQVHERGVDANLYPILADENLHGQIAQANRLGHGNVHVWCI